MFKKQGFSQTFKALLLFFFSALSLFLGLFMNSWHVADKEWFDDHLYQMEAYVLGRMVKSHQDGILSSGGLLGLGSLDEIPVKAYDDKPDPAARFDVKCFSNQSLAYVNGLQFGAYSVYQSQIGGQGIFFSILDRFTALSPQKRLRLFYALTALFSAITLSVIVLWFYLEFGFIVAFCVLISAIFSPWLVVIGRKLYWSLWSFYLPMAMIFIYLKFKGGMSDIKPFILGVIIFTGIFIKCLFSGYEYIAAPLVMMIVPLVYYGILNRLNFYRSLKVLITAVFSSCLAILLSFIILCVQIGSVKGSFMNGVDHIIYSLEKRSYGNSQDFPSIYTTSLESSAVSVLSKYLNGSFFGPKKYLSSSKRFLSKYLLRVHYSYVILLFMIMSGIVYFLRNRSFTEKEKQTHLALIFSTWFSILSPLSWFIIFKAHSYIHTNANFIVWHMPFIFFGFAVSGLAIKSLLSILIPTNNSIHPIQ